MTFDIKCLELAQHFLDDHAELNTAAARTTLAQAIQQAAVCALALSSSP